jgi:hypothetical protein
VARSKILWTNTAVGNQKYIIEQMKTYIQQGGGGYEDWFIGLANNPIAPITEVSRLGKVQNHRFTYIEAISGEVAKGVVDYFINACGTDGNTGEAEKRDGCRALYLYKKAEHLVACETRTSSRIACWMRNKLFGVCASDNNKAIRRLYAP